MTLRSAQTAFEAAKAAFEAGDFVNATAFASIAKDGVFEDIAVLRPAAEGAPLCSIIVVTRGPSADLDNLLQEIASYSHKDFEIVLVINGTDAIQIPASCPGTTVVQVGFNYGCSGGRNIGAQIARGEFVIFLDDDGVLKKGSIESLIELAHRYGAIAVRGRVIPRTCEGLGRLHYDYGDKVLYSAPNTEGISLWRRKEFLAFGGFDTLLAGHEGIALLSKMFRFYGPESFLYDPFAVLYHDYAANEALLEEKIQKHKFNATYLAYAYPTAGDLKAALHVRRDEIGARLLFAGLHRAMDTYAPERPLEQLGISVLTVAKNVAPLLEDYTRALKHQTFANFEIVFVDQGSTDGTRDRLAELWQHDGRLRLRQSRGGRAEALNLAVAEAANDICVIAEADDLSLPRRLELTARHFLAASSGWLSFAAFSERELFRGATWPVGASLRTRCLAEPPAFGTVSFRKASFTVPFDVSRDAGCEGKWMSDNLGNSRVKGVFIPLHGVFERNGEAITDAEREGKLAQLYSAHEQLLGAMSEEDRWCCRVLGGLEQFPTKTSIDVIENYILRLAAGNAEKRLYDQTELQDFLVSCKTRLEVQKLRTLNGRYKREMRRFREACRKYEEQLAGREAGGKDATGQA